MKILLWTILAACLVINSYGIAQPDTNFKSIHQLQSEEHKKDTTDYLKQNDTAPNNPLGMLNKKQPVQTIINFSLVVFLMVVLIIALGIFLIARRIYRTKI